MAQYELLLPKMGESVAEATVIKWIKQPGDKVELDDTILEIATDKVDSEVPSPVAGTLVRHLYREDEVVQVGSIIAIIDTEDIDEPTEVPFVNQIKEEDILELNAPAITEDLPTAQDSLESESSHRFYSPLVKNIANQENISLPELEGLKGTGADGRLTKDDLLSYISNKPSKDSPKPLVSEPTITANKPAYSVSGGDEVIEMDRMRRFIADHMVMSASTAPHVTSFVEADVTNLVLWRERVKVSFEKREGEKITFTPIFIEAVTKAIKDFPMINVSVNGTQIIKKRDINIGMAAALPSGNLIVPVIKNADQLNLVGLTKSVNDLAGRARNSKLKPDETQNGTFTLTNVGSFGNVMGTPIINQPQVAILAVGAIKKKPAVLETEFGDVIAIRHMMFLSLSYDHRVVDGALGGSFVRRVADYLENWDINREI
ncbi:dihydrolipoamide acetyltransferase family protein [Pedobacter sp. JCM 36344]|uniref:dihydrolipoamide acetyltransferase family protein n=1 Tax=Pedobacter sp. JCM 36344 TaxID=3374280 RepID=UPI00397E2310